MAHAGGAFEANPIYAPHTLSEMRLRRRRRTGFEQSGVTWFISRLTMQPCAGTTSSEVGALIESATFDVWRVEQPGQAEGLGHAWAKLIAV